MSIPCYLAIANPESKRWQAYAHDLTGFWAEHGIKPEVVVLPWREVLTTGAALEDLPPFAQPALVRLESPGRDFEVMKLLLEAGGKSVSGAAKPPSEPADAGQRAGSWREIPYMKGRLVRPGLLYHGFRATLGRLGQVFVARPHLCPLACPLDIAEMFDKRATAERLRAAQLPCPPALFPGKDPGELLEQLRKKGWSTAYVKLNTGSSASGIAVVHPLDDPPWAVTSVLRRGDDFFNTRRLVRVHGRELETVLEFLLGEEAVVQQGIAMAQIDGQNFDVRVVMIHGRPAFTVFRLSSQPMTNLHLGGRRGHWSSCRVAIPTRTWLDALDHCTAATRLYPACTTLGIDLLFERSYLRHYLLEINAFGDFFPGLKDEQGRTIHRVEIEETARRHGLIQ